MIHNKATQIMLNSYAALRRRGGSASGCIAVRPKRSTASLTNISVSLCNSGAHLAMIWVLAYSRRVKTELISIRQYHGKRKKGIEEIGGSGPSLRHMLNIYS